VATQPGGYGLVANKLRILVAGPTEREDKCGVETYVAPSLFAGVIPFSGATYYSLKPSQVVHDVWLLPWFLDATFGAWCAAGKRLRLCVKIDFGVHVCGVDAGMTQPSSYRVDVHTSA
jgi:hypothetical protein